MVWSEKSACLVFFKHFCNFRKKKDQEPISQRQKFPSVWALSFLLNFEPKPCCAFSAYQQENVLTVVLLIVVGPGLSPSHAVDIIHSLKCAERDCHFGHWCKTCEPMDCGNIFKLFIVLLIL